MHEHKNIRVLFILKFRESGDLDDCHPYSYHAGFSSGLLNSAQFVADMLNREPGVLAKIAQVTDANDIDREVAAFRPTHAVIEALWVVPEKFKELKRLHPRVDWIVRVHSEIPFLSYEGIAIDWIVKYSREHVRVASNSKRTVEDIRFLLRLTSEQLLWPADVAPYLPNYYPVDWHFLVSPVREDDIVNVGCFGTIRPMKNQLLQAIAAMMFADRIQRRLRFHINHTRCEQGGVSVLKNMRALFDHTGHFLVEHPWHGHEKFLWLASSMDVGMQVSLSETFSIIAADMTYAGVPVIGSPEIPWLSWWSRVDPTLSDEIASHLQRAYRRPEIILDVNRLNLNRYSARAKRAWLDFLEG